RLHHRSRILLTLITASRAGDRLQRTATDHSRAGYDDKQNANAFTLFHARTLTTPDILSATFESDSDHHPTRHRYALTAARPTRATQIDGRRVVRYKVFMQTLSLTEARANLTKLCQSALDGLDVAIVHNGKLVKLQPVHEVAELSDGEAMPDTDKVLAERAKKARRPLTTADRKRILASVKK
ncbi:MAG: hypothetical protein QOF48_1576, partial [Verrucomicrobiota bacterium]